MENKALEMKLEALRKSIDKLILIELCKNKVKRDQARAILGSFDNEQFARINMAINKQNVTK